MNLNKADNKVKANGKVKYAGGCVTSLIPLFLLMSSRRKRYSIVTEQSSKYVAMQSKGRRCSSGEGGRNGQK